MGQHEGVHQWTLGQRAKIMRGHEAYVVVAKDAASAQIHVAADMDHPALYAENFVTGEPHWISGGAPPELSSRSRNASNRVLHMDKISVKTPNSKCRLFLKLLTSKGIWRQVFICLSPPSPVTLYECITMYLFTQGRGGWR